MYFTPRRLWMGSANLTQNSRRSLEFGLWADDPSLLSRMTSFLTDLLKYSELLVGFAAAPEPERVPYEFDDAAKYEYLRDLGSMVRAWAEPARSGARCPGSACRHLPRERLSSGRL